MFTCEHIFQMNDMCWLIMDGNEGKVYQNVGASFVSLWWDKTKRWIKIKCVDSFPLYKYPIFGSNDIHQQAYLIQTINTAAHSNLTTGRFSYTVVSNEKESVCIRWVLV
jgi:hypothetical protein